MFAEIPTHLSSLFNDSSKEDRSVYMQTCASEYIKVSNRKEKYYVSLGVPYYTGPGQFVSSKFINFIRHLREQWSRSKRTLLNNIFLYIVDVSVHLGNYASQPHRFTVKIH